MILRLKNELSVTADIYLDGEFIGDEEDESSRTWSVPSGIHTAKQSAVIRVTWLKHLLSLLEEPF